MIGSMKRLIAFTLAAVLVPASALATAPGVNGRIGFRRYLGPDRTQGAIFIANPDGTQERQLTRPPRKGGDDYPDVSPDGSFVAFERCVNACGLYIVNTDRTDLHRVEREGCRPGGHPPACADSSYVAISPGGKELAFNRGFGRVRDDQIDHAGV